MLVGEGGRPAAVGCAVLVTLGGRKAVGYIVGLEEVVPSPDEGTDLWGTPQSAADLKQVEAVLSAPFFDEEGAACALWLAERYAAPLSECARLFTPPRAVPRIVRGRDGRWRVEEPAIGEVDDRWVTRGPAFDAFVPRKNAVKQQEVLAAVGVGDVARGRAVSGVRRRGFHVEGAGRQGGCHGGAAPAHARHGRRGLARGRAGRRGGCSGPHCGPAAHRRPASGRGRHRGRPGRRRRARGARGRRHRFRQDRGVPAGHRAHARRGAPRHRARAGDLAHPQTVARFRGRFGDAVAVMHSRMSDGERYDQWDFIKSGAARVVVGARSALFTPAANVGLIVIDEEHEGSYKQDSSPRYHARDVAEWMMARAGGALVLGSATPSIEALYQVNKNPRWTAAALPERANGRPMPAIEVVDMAAEFASGSRAMFSGRLARALGEELAQGRKAVLLLNQRGFAKFLLCRDCGFVPECPHCSTSLTYHEQGAKLVCHHCGYAVAAPPTCPECGSPYLKKFGAGTQRVETELRQLLDGLPGVGPTVPIIRMDADTTQAKGAHQELLESFAAADAAVLLGTQMIAKGLDFDDVTLVGVINADTQLHLPDYRAGERTFQLIEQVAGRAGRAELDGRVMVQTYEADDVAIRAAATYNRGMFLRAELPKRKLLGYPPYVRMANVLLWGADEHAVATEAELLHAQLAELIRNEVGDRWQVLPAVPCVLAKLRNTYRYHIVVKAPLGDDLSAPLVRLFRARKVNPAVNAAVDIDPVDLL